MENLLDQEFLNYLQGFEENWLTILPNAIRPVRNQGNIGACAAFGTTDATSALHVINGGESVTLSAQEFVDHLHDRIEHRADIPVNEGAVLPPTTIHHAFTMMEVFGVFEENVYPYTGVKAQVRTIPPEAMNRGRKMFIKSYVPISRRQPLKAIRALRRQPIVGIMRAPKYFKKFRGPGTYRGPRLKFERAPYQCVLIVGHGIDSKGRDCFLIKNSHGPRFGFRGFAEVAKSVMVGFAYPVDPEFRRVRFSRRLRGF